MSFFDVLKNVLIILFTIQFVPVLVENVSKQYAGYFQEKTSIGVIKINKPLYDATPYIRQFRDLCKDSHIKAIVLRIDCPGSSAGAAQSLFEEIVELKKEYSKPVISYVPNIATSGGYWISCSADYIIAQGTSLIGSIGATFPHLFQIKEFLDQHKVSAITLKSGAYKTIGDPFSVMTPQEKALLQGVLDDSYDQFVTTVSDARKISKNSLHEWAEGKIFTGRQAKKLGLVDELGSVHALMNAIKDRALVVGQIDWVYHKQPTNFLRSIFNWQEDDDADDGQLFSTFLEKIYTFLERKFCQGPIF